MCKKKSESVTHIRVTGGSEESIIMIKFIRCCYSHYSVGPFVSKHPPPPPDEENGVARCFALPFCIAGH